MIALSKFSRSLTLCLCLVYVFTGSGLDKLTFQAVSIIYRTAVFPCKGKGCQCDKAGYELSNCQCNHDEGISCCGTSEPEEEEESCCSEETEKDGLQIANIPCQGVEENQTLSLAKHVVLLPHVIINKHNFLPNNKTPYISTLKGVDILPSDKVPIKFS